MIFFICIKTKIDKFDILNLPDGYTEFTKYRKHFKKKSGGITVIFKNVFKKCLNFIETDSDFVLWFRINPFSENHNYFPQTKFVRHIVFAPFLIIIMAPKRSL
jgi:hypothetical protein